MEAERRPVEVIVRDEPVVLLPTAAAEADSEDGWMRGAGQLLDASKGRERNLRLPAHGAGERVAARERVVDADVVETTPDGRPLGLST